MKKSTKIIIGVGAVIVIGTAIVLLGKNKSKESRSEGGKLDSGNGNGSSENTQTKPNYPSTGFSNKVEGDAFRLWVNTKYPSYAKQIDLDKSGSFDNSYIRKAYQKYGTEYKQSNKSPYLKVAKNVSSSTTSGGKTTVPFKDGEYKAIFYGNNRFATFKKSGGGFISKGSYTDGGKILKVTDGYNKGNEFISPNVVKNLNDTLSFALGNTISSWFD